MTRARCNWGLNSRAQWLAKSAGSGFTKARRTWGGHTAHLWSSAGSLQASATFSGETASGWQQVNFATPVSILANTVYVASYLAPQGFYSADGNYFAAAHVSGTLTAPASTGAGGNGVYAYQATSKFPNSTFSASNYWLDVVFTT